MVYARLSGGTGTYQTSWTDLDEKMPTGYIPAVQSDITGITLNGGTFTLAIHEDGALSCVQSSNANQDRRGSLTYFTNDPEPLTD